MSQTIDYATHTDFNPDTELGRMYGEAIQRLQAAFSTEEDQLDAIRADAAAALEAYTVGFRVGAGVSPDAPHRPVRERFAHTVPR